MTAVSAIENDRIDDDEQGSVRLGLKWWGGVDVDVAYGTTIPISPPSTSEEPEGLLLLSEDTEAVRKNDSTWITRDDPLVGSLEMNTTTFEPGDVVSNEYSIWGSGEHFEAIPPGSYHFEDINSTRFDSVDDFSYTVDLDIERL